MCVHIVVEICGKLKIAKIIEGLKKSLPLGVTKQKAGGPKAYGPMLGKLRYRIACSMRCASASVPFQ